MRGVACVLAACVCACACAAERGPAWAPVVRTRAGRVRGLRGAGGGRQYFGIPYASARRFEAPRDPQKWKGTLNAVNSMDSCAQTYTFLTFGVENCLHLDVYSPDSVKPGDKLPVLVFIYGGAYYFGTRVLYDPEYLVNKDVVVVIPNYRVGVLGFLCINGAANLGLKDQAAALKWIQINIAAFGGDPDNVTLMGHSSGANAVGMHILSKISAGLFHRAILMSGDPFTLWAFNLEYLKSAFEDARKIAPNVQTKADVYETFANASIWSLLAATHDTLLHPRYFKYTPCVEENSTDPFFHDTPFNIIKSGNFNKVPVIIGTTKVEGLLLYGLHDDSTLKDWNKNFMEWLPSVFSWCSKDDKISIANEIRSHYFGNKTINKAVKKGLVDFFSDWLITSSTEAFSDLLMEYSGQPVYRYVFSYEGWRNYMTLAVGSAGDPRGPTHTDDIFYLFRPFGLPVPLAQSDELFIDTFTTTITNFMKFGDPTPRRSALLPERWAPAPCWLRLERRPALQCGAPPAPPRGSLRSLCPRMRPGYGPCAPAPSCHSDTFASTTGHS